MSWSEVSMAPLGPGAIVGPYEISGHLATGGMGEVYIARKKGIGGFERMVVLKIMLPHLAHDPRFARMFIDEARICSQLSHPNIVQVFDLGESDIGALYLAMEHLAGLSVAACVKTMAHRDLRIPVEIVARIVCDAAIGLAYAHAATDGAGEPLDLVHRDISPENLFVTYAGPTKILDFGVAKVRDRLAKTQHGEFKGKVGYMAPEIIKGQPVDPRCDLFSLGIVLFEMLSNRRLFHAAVPATALHRVLAAPIPPVQKLRPEVDLELAGIVHALLARDPERRMRTAEETAERLERWLAGRDVTNKVVGQWLQSTFKDAHEANARIARLVEQTGKLDAKEIEHARRAVGEDLADTLVRELTPDERDAVSGSGGATSDVVEEAAFAETAAGIVDHDDGWIRRARISRWVMAIAALAVMAFFTTKAVERSIADVRDLPRVGSSYADHFAVDAVHEDSPASVLASATDDRDNEKKLIRTTPKIPERRGVVLAAINRANVGLEKLARPELPAATLIGIQEGRIYTVYPVDGSGRTLREMLAKEAVSWSRARRLAIAIADVISAANATGVVHGAIEPAAIWVLEKKDAPRVLGFQGGVVTFEQIGGRSQASPEQKPDVPQDATVDQYAVAVLIQDLLKALDQEGAIAAAGVLTRATAVDPMARYRDTHAFAVALREALGPKS